MSSTSPLISVLLPVYNAARYLGEALASIQAQNIGDFELIAVDDGSTDGSFGILHDHAARDQRICILSRPNTGIVGALNDGLALARGTFIARMDADDISLPDRFAMQIAYLKQNPDCVVVSCGVLRVDPDNWPLALRPACLVHDEIERHMFEGEGSVLCHGSMMMRRQVLEALGGYRRESQFNEDVDLFLRAAEIGRLANVPEILYRYRRHATSASAVFREAQWQAMQCIRRDVCVRRGLPPPPLTERHPVATPDELPAYWATLAAREGFHETARKHATSPFLLLNGLDIA